jgi:hypothetical protein
MVTGAQGNTVPELVADAVMTTAEAMGGLENSSASDAVEPLELAPPSVAGADQLGPERIAAALQGSALRLSDGARTSAALDMRTADHSATSTSFGAGT